MEKEIKNKTITLGELKKTIIEMPNSWLKDLYRRYSDKELVQINFKDFINKII